MRAVNLAPQPVQQRVVDRDNDRLAGLRQALGDQLRHSQPELVDRPARVAEEAVRAGVMPDPRQPGADQHSRNRP
jgi:hypothetical protein